MVISFVYKKSLNHIQLTNYKITQIKYGTGSVLCLISKGKRKIYAGGHFFIIFLNRMIWPA